MTLFHMLQLLWLAAALTIATKAAWSIMFRSALDAQLFLGAWSDAQCDARKDLAARLLDGARGAAIAALLRTSSVGSDRPSCSDVVVSKLREEALRPVGKVRALGRIASPLAFLGVMAELAAAFSEKQGLAGLQRGAVETVALEHAVFGLVIGLATSSICITATGHLAQAASRRLKELRLTLEVIDDVCSVRIET